MPLVTAASLALSLHFQRKASRTQVEQMQLRFMLPTAAWKLIEIQVRDFGYENDNGQSNWKRSSGATMTGSHCTASSFFLLDSASLTINHGSPNAQSPKFSKVCKSFRKRCCFHP